MYEALRAARRAARRGEFGTVLSALAMQQASTAQKVEAFQRIRLRGRPMPEDLHRLLVAYWEDHPTADRVFQLWELDFLDPY